MKNILFLFIVLSTGLAFAQNPKTEDVGNFTEVKVFDRIKVDLIKGDENKVILSGKDVDDIEIINKNGTLKIRMNLDKVYDGDQTHVQVYYTTLKTIDGNEGAQITSNEAITQEYLELRMQEGASIRAALKLKDADMRAVTGGIIDVSGEVEKQEIQLNTGGIFNGKELHSKTTKLRIQAGGEAEINASDLANIKIRAGGEVEIYGSPKQVVKDKLIGGSIRLMD